MFDNNLVKRVLCPHCGKLCSPQAEICICGEPLRKKSNYTNEIPKTEGLPKPSVPKTVHSDPNYEIIKRSHAIAKKRRVEMEQSKKALKKAEKATKHRCKCGESFLTESSYYDHIINCQKELFLSDDKGIFHCICGDFFFSKLSLFYHYHYQKNSKCMNTLLLEPKKQSPPLPKKELDKLEPTITSKKPTSLPKRPYIKKEKTSRPKTIDENIDGWLNKLIDLSRRNRQLYFRRYKYSTIKLIKPSAKEIYNSLVNRTNIMTIIYRDIENLSKSKIDLAEFFDEAIKKDPLEYKKPLKRGEILTDKEDKDLYKGLRQLHLRSKTSFEEQGVNILYIAIGFLQWKDVTYSEQVNLTPLILVPVLLIRESLMRPYKIQYFDEDILINPALSLKLERDFRIALPEFDQSCEDINIVFKEIQSILDGYSETKSWKIIQDVYLGTFTFTKLMMYKDLDENRTLIRNNEIIKQLIRETCKESFPFYSGEELDNINPQNVYHILDADSSQQNAILAAENKKTYTLQGPPGTGKSQTIANIIGSSLASNKTILFVSAKMAALEIVMRRLEDCGIGDFCLELHSYKSNKKTVFQELGRFLVAKSDYNQPKTYFFKDLLKNRRYLNNYFKNLIKKEPPFNVSAYYIHGKLLELQTVTYIDFKLEIKHISRSEFENLITLFKNISAVRPLFSNYYEHGWYGFDIKHLSFQFRNSIVNTFEDIIEIIEKLKDLSGKIQDKIKIPGFLVFGQIYEFFKFSTEKNLDFLLYNLDEIYNKFNRDYQSFFRVFKSEYRRDVKKIRYKLKITEKCKYSDYLQILNSALMKKSFINIPNLLDWYDINIKMPLEPLIKFNPDFFTYLNDLIKDYITYINLIKNYFPDWNIIFNKKIELFPFDDLIDWLNNKINTIDNIDDWENIEKIRLNFQELGSESLFKIALKNDLKITNLEKVFEKYFYTKYIDLVNSKNTILSQFNSTRIQLTLQKFKELDRKHIETSKRRIQYELAKKIPTSNQWIGAESSAINILQKELMKKRRVKPIRRLFREIPGLIQIIKPCLLMSPLSISKYLDPKIFKFDIIIFDEASQIKPQDAIGAIMRGQQAIVVGDRKQLPPTSFFDTISDDYDEEDYEAFDFESILDRFYFSFPRLMLNYHYRSKDESLIAFSNNHFYDGRLYTFPGVSYHREDIGIDFIYVEDGIYDKGKSRKNRIEARKVAQVALKHFKLKPDYTLGIVAFSQAQQDAISEEVENLIRNNPEYESYFYDGGLEPFFIKNLENVQGDERDVIIFSVGYGKDSQGKLSMNFGPINKSGGERRLNVAITRARYAVKIVSSIRSSEIDVSRTKSYGVKLLKQYLEYAEHKGEIGYIKSRQEYFEKDFDSPFEEEVFKALTELGYTIHNQVGCSGFKIDLAIAHPNYPGKYILGIECDGRLYHSSFTARDRDRIRQDFLESLGWKIHRIWSSDWINNSEREIKKIKALIDKYLPLNPVPSKKILTKKSSKKKVELSEEDFNNLSKTGKKINVSILPDDFVSYTEFKKHYSNYFLNVNYNNYYSLNRLKKNLSTVITNIVQTESPIKMNELFNRVSNCLWINRLGPRMKRIIESTVSSSYCRNVRKNGDVLWKLNQKIIPVRYPQGENKRRILNIPLEEIAQGISYMLRDALTLSLGESLLYAGKIFGYNSVSGSTKEYMFEALQYLVRIGYVEKKEDKYMLKDRNHYIIKI